MRFNFTQENYKAEIDRYIGELETQVKAKVLSVQDALPITEELTDAYVEQVGEVPEAQALERLANVLLNDELSDKNEHKMTHEEFPILSNEQEARRKSRVHVRGGSEGGEVPLEWADEIATDGTDKRPKTRDNNRKMRDALRLRPSNKYVRQANEARQRRYRAFTKTQPVIKYNVSELPTDSRLRR